MRYPRLSRRRPRPPPDPTETLVRKRGTSLTVNAIAERSSRCGRTSVLARRDRHLTVARRGRPAPDPAIQEQTSRRAPLTRRTRLIGCLHLKGQRPRSRPRGVAEEALFRGYLFSRLRRNRSFWRASALASVSFVLVHLYLFVSLPWPVALASVLLATIISFPLAHLFELGGNTIWPSALLHFTVQGAVRVDQCERGITVSRLSLCASGHCDQSRLRRKTYRGFATPPSLSGSVP